MSPACAIPLCLVLAALVAPRPTSAQGGPASLVVDLTDTVNAGAGADPERMVALGDELCFAGWHPLTGRELWCTDGTPEGTRLVADACPGTCSFHSLFTDFFSPQLVALGDVLFYESCYEIPDPIEIRDTSAEQRCELWRSDGTSAGTFAVTQFDGFGVSPLAALNGTLYFEARDGRSGNALHRSDGTPGGTEIVKNLIADASIRNNVGNQSMRFMGPAAGRLFLAPFGGYDLWTSDGTPEGTDQLRRQSFITEPFANFITSPFLGTETHAFFTVQHTRLWASDGTPEGTEELSSFGGTSLAPFAGELYFTGGSKLWRTDVATAGIRLVKDGFLGTPEHGTPFGGELYFAAEDLLRSSKVWKSDGTEEGTIPVAHFDDLVLDLGVFEETIYAGTESGIRRIAEGDATLVAGGFAADSLTPFRDALAFRAERPAEGTELAVTSGFGAVTLTEIAAPGSSHPTNLTEHDGALFFTIDPGPSGYGLYESRGSARETRLLGSFEYPPMAMGAGGRTFVVEGDLWAFDEAGELVLLLDAQPRDERGTMILQSPSELPHLPIDDSATAFQDDLYFLVWNDRATIELWASDGTARGTRRLDTLAGYGGEYGLGFVCDVGNGCPLPRYGIVPYSDQLLGDQLLVYFEKRLWRHDGSAGGATQLLDLQELCDFCRFDSSALVGDRLFLTTSGSGAPPRHVLWTSDGTESGTRMVRGFDSRIGAGGFVGLDETLFFVVHDELGEELWKSDGTPDGTAQVRDIRAGAGSSNPRELTVLDGRLYFAADDGVNGRELWTSDGTTEGTVLLADLRRPPMGQEDKIRPDGVSSFPQALAAIDGVLYFAADDGVHGLELWTSDGTAAGTRILQDVQPGPLPSSPSSFTAAGIPPDSPGAPAGSLVYFVAGTEENGFELWAMSATVPEDCAEGCLLDGRFAVTVEWKNQHAGGAQGVGHPVHFSDKTLFFWFFSPSNIELLVKVLDGRAINEHFWVFYGALTDVEYTIRVEDRLTGEVSSYHNPPGNLCGNGDVTAFGTAAAVSEGKQAPGSCVPGPRTLCLLDGRFRVEVEWKNQHAGGVEGTGHAVPGTRQTGYFWFFDSKNVELAVKVLDGRSVNGKFWVFYGGLSDVEYRITVTNTESGASREYRNPPGEICGLGDTGAF